MQPSANPFERMEQLFDQMRRSMDTWPEGWDESRPDESRMAALPGAYEREVSGFQSNLSLETVDDDYVVLADLPGFEREEIDVRFVDGRVTIAAVHEAGDGDEYRSREVSESITLPGEVASDEATATYRNGVLEIHLPRVSDEDDTRSIPVE